MHNRHSNAERWNCLSTILGDDALRLKVTDKAARMPSLPLAKEPSLGEAVDVSGIYPLNLRIKLIRACTPTEQLDQARTSH